MPRTLSDFHFLGAELMEYFERGRHDRHVRIDTGVAVELDHVRLEQDPLAADIEAAGFHAFENPVRQVIRIALRLDDRDRGKALGTPFRALEPQSRPAGKRARAEDRKQVPSADP